MTPIAATELSLEQDLEALARRRQEELARDPENPELLHALGRLMGQLLQPDLELALIGQAIARAPRRASFHADLGLALLEAGLPEDARECFAEALAIEPGQADALGGLADLALDANEVALARSQGGAGASLGRRGDRVRARLALLDGDLVKATEHFLAYLADNPMDATALFYLGVALQGRDLLEPAAASYTRAALVKPDLYEAHANLATVLGALGRHAESLIAADRAVELAPERPGSYLNRANAERELGDLDGAVKDLSKAVELAPGYAEAWSTLANLCHDVGEMSLALDAHQRAVALAPELAQAHWNRSFTLLATGQLAAGWDEYEWRRQTVAARPEPRDLPWPQWAGQPLAGRHILVWREQGLGDELLFLSCLADVVKAAGRVTALVSPRLVSLVRRAFPSVDVRPDGPTVGDHFDYQVGLGSLPRWLRRDRTVFPARGDFLVADPAQTTKWAARLAALPAGAKVGLCWRSGLLTPDRRRQYAPLAEFRQLLETPGIVWVNLQYDECREEIAEVERSWGIRIHQWEGEDLKNDLESVVGLIAALDGVVTAATAVSSLAGAVGRPSWQVDSGSDWTVFGEARSPWFPSLAVVAKRPDDKDWGRVMTEIRSGVAGLKVLGTGAET